MSEIESESEIESDICNIKLNKSASIMYKNGDTYEGEINSINQPHGKGKMLYKSGAKYEGEWRYGNRDGKGVFTFMDGRKFEGTFSEDDEDGMGTLYDEKNRILEKGEYTDGVLTFGFKYLYDDNGMAIKYDHNNIQIPQLHRISALEDKLTFVLDELETFRKLIKT